MKWLEIMICLDCYYDFTTFDVLNLPHFATICHFGLSFWIVCVLSALRKVQQNAADCALTGRFFEMIKVLFICHGRG